jgi:hypothetical protein
MVVDEGYQPERALTLFRMGVDEYISVLDHALEFATVLRRLLAVTPTDSAVVQESIASLSRDTRVPLTTDSLWLAAASSA